MRDVLLGVVIGAQGLKGEVKVKTFTEAPNNLRAYGPLRSRAGRTLTIADLREANGFAIVSFEGVGDRDAAEALKGTELYVSRATLPGTNEQEFYHADLLGLRAEDELGRSIGKVIAVHNFGAGDVIEIVRDDNGSVLMPFTREIVPTVDLEQGRIVVAAPEEVEAETKGSVE
jgi:16S rRNA processing protein RimM